jgi:hypothetical protein
MRRQLPDPRDLEARISSKGADKAPSFPERWKASVLLTPFGDAAPPIAAYSQLVIGEVEYDHTVQAMRVSLYLTQSQTYFDFLFVNGAGWYWLDSKPGGQITSWYGPFETTLNVPAPDFLRQMGSRYGSTWAIMGTPCESWIVPTPVESGEPDHGSWYSVRLDNGHPFRIFTFDANNPCRIPILGSFYMANFPTFRVEGRGLAGLLREIRRAPSTNSVAYSNPLLTQRDIQTAIANPLASSTCTPEMIDSVMPGFHVMPGGALPQWTDKTYIEGTTIGTDFIPYPTTVFYWFSSGLQQSIFIGLGLVSGQGRYDTRQDTCLFRDYTDIPQYSWIEGKWVATCSNGRLDGVGVPRPVWVAADGGQIVASIKGNPYFGLGSNEVLNLIACPLMRAPGELALFWVWFTMDERGVLFTEANFVNSTDHNLQLIDYQLFQRDAAWIDSNCFADPSSSLPACTVAPMNAPPPKRMMGPVRKRRLEQDPPAEAQSSET